MEKINKEELMKKLNLTEEELKKVVGGEVGSDIDDCIKECEKVYNDLADRDCAALCLPWDMNK